MDAFPTTAVERPAPSGSGALSSEHDQPPQLQPDCSFLDCRAVPPDYAELAANNPHGLASPPATTGEQVVADVLFHVTYTSEAKLSDFLRTLWATRPILVALDVEHGSFAT